MSITSLGSRLMWSYLAIAIIGVVVSYLVNQFPPLRSSSARVRSSAVLIVLLLCVATAFLYWRLSSDQKVTAEIVSPENGDRVNRPAVIRAKVYSAVPAGHSLWLGYRNELGGPYVWQGSPCQVIGENLDCGPVYLGSNESDSGAFHVFLVHADEAATATLTEQGKQAGAGVGANSSRPSWVDGATVMSERRNLQLKALPAPTGSPTASQPLSISVTCTVGGQPSPGARLKLTYNITATQPTTVGVGASIYDDTGVDRASGAGDQDGLALTAGTNTIHRTLQVPSALPPGDYEIDAEVWPTGKIGAESVEVLAEAKCAEFTAG